jgi:hypothetical protein
VQKTLQALELNGKLWNVKESMQEFIWMPELIRTKNDKSHSNKNIFGQKSFEQKFFGQSLQLRLKTT